MEPSLNGAAASDENICEVPFHVFETMMQASFKDIALQLSPDHGSSPVWQDFRRNGTEGFRYYVMYLIREPCGATREFNYCIDFKYIKLRVKPSNICHEVHDCNNRLRWCLPFCLVRVPGGNEFVTQVEVRIRSFEPIAQMPICNGYNHFKNYRL